jgi:hypothetical protein
MMPTFAPLPSTAPPVPADEDELADVATLLAALLLLVFPPGAAPLELLPPPLPELQALRATAEATPSSVRVKPVLRMRERLSGWSWTLRVECCAREHIPSAIRTAVPATNSLPTDALRDSRGVRVPER